MDGKNYTIKKGNPASPLTCRLRVVIYVERSLQIPLFEITTSTPHIIKRSHTLVKFAGQITVKMSQYTF